MAGEGIVQPWGSGVLPKGPPKTTYYDQYGRSYVLPADPYSVEHYQERGLRLTPPESPAPLEEDPWLAETQQRKRRKRKR